MRPRNTALPPIMPRADQYGSFGLTCSQVTPSAVAQMSRWNASGARANCGTVCPPMIQILSLIQTGMAFR